jgi:eukaryotic-like serine/threonine-protein kinase
VTSALDLAIFCYDGAARATCDISELTRQALALERNNFTMARSAFALALNGWPTEAETLAAELRQQFPQDTLFNAFWLPLLRAVQALRDQQPNQAIEHLRAVERYEAATRFNPQYLRGLAWVQLQAGPNAAAEFAKIRSHRHLDPNAPLYSLAQLALARAAALQRDSTKSRQAYQDFFASWKTADASLPELRATRREDDSLK